MTYEEVLTWYHSFEKFGVVPGLDRVKMLCARLNDPQKKLRCVHVTGTNGKGSVCTEVANVLRCAGYKTALYTSPEVIDFRERMQINGEMISADELCRVTEKVKSALEQVNEEGVFPTQFEVVTAAAFLWFAERDCDIAVLETGLGGRYDATNIIETPLVCAVVSVSLDHVGILGDTVEKIAWEKSGIFKSGAQVIASASVPQGAQEVIRSVASENGCGVLFADEKDIFDLSRLSENTVGYKDVSFRLPFYGYHQVRNASLAVCICDALTRKGFVISTSHIAEGISGSRIPARTEIICREPFVMLDGCHNDASTAALADVLKTVLPEKKILAVMGMMADKDCKKNVLNLAPCFSYVVTVKPSNPRSAEAFELADTVRAAGVDAFAVEDPKEGIDFAADILDSFDALIVCGSLYLAADIREYLIRKFKKET